MAIQGFFTGDVKIRDLNGVLKAVDGIVEVATDAGTVTSVGLTVGSTGTDVNVANSPVTTSGNITLNLPTASATNRGLLSSADWSTFNSKQNALGYTAANAATTLTINGTTYDLSANRSWSVGTHTGSLTSGYIPKATGTTTLADGLLYDTGSAVLLGTQTAGSGKFMVYSTTADNHYQAIGTAPSFRFADTIVSPSYTGIIGLATATNHFIIGAAAGDMVLANNTTSSIGNFLFGTGATERMRISPTGNVSIGGTGNTYKLDVTGTGRFSGQLRLESTITNGTYTYTLPGATGTLALTSDIPVVTGYVPYTGATGAVNLGAYDLLVQTLTIGKGNSSLANNTALGYRTLFHITTGNYNTAVGYESSHNTTTGQYNTSLGQSALFTNTTGSQNTAIGLNALLLNTTGGSNVVVGLDALQHNTTGSSNTALGYNAGSHITGGSTPNTTASSSVYIGRDTKAKVDGGSNEIVIGYNAIGNGSNTATFGNTSTTANYFTGSINGGSFVKSGGTSAQFLKADGSVDSSTYYLASNPSAFIALTALSATAPLSYSNTTGVFSISQATTSTDGYLSSTDWNTFYNKQAAGSYITALTGEATATGPGSATVTLSTSAVTGKLLTGLNLTGGGSIAATDSILQAFGKVQNQISGLAGGVTYQGTWNASTNTPTLTSSVGTKGYYYIVDVAGSTNLNGITDWKIGDWAIFNGSTWDKVDNTDAVSSVNGFTGAVSLTTSNIAEGTNLYYLDSRARLALSFTAGSGAYDNTTGVITIPTNTSQLTNGANFITLSSLSASSPLSYNSGSGAFSIQVANGSQNGYLSSTDWTTFNGKQAALNGTGFVKISGTTISYDNSTYVTTDTFQTISASKTFGVGFSLASAGGTNQLTSFVNTNSIHSGSAGTNIFGFNNSNNIYFGKGLSNGGVITYNNAAVRFYALKDADGTIAFTSDIPSLTGYVPYTGATASLNLGTNNITSQNNSLDGNGTTTGGFYGIKQYSSSNSGAQGYTSLYALAQNSLYIRYSQTNGTAKNVELSSALLGTTIRQFLFPDASGTFALTSDIPSLSGYVQGSGTTNYLPKFTGTSTIGNSAITDDGSMVTLNSRSMTIDAASNTFGELIYREGGSLKWNAYNDYNTDNYVLGNSGGSRLFLTQSGNLGLGVTPSAWGSNSFAFQTQGGAVWSFNSAYMDIWQNSYYNGASSIYQTNAAASFYRQTAGRHEWNTASSGTAGTTISWTQAMTLDASGRLGIGTTSPLEKLHIFGSGANTQTIQQESSASSANCYIGQKSASKAYITGLSTDFSNSWIIYDATAAALRFSIASTGAATFSSSVTATNFLASNGGLFGWGAGSTFIDGDSSNQYIRFIVNNSERVRINSSGNVGIGTTIPSSKLHIESSTFDDFIKLTITGIGSMGITATNPRGIQTTDAAGNFVGWHVTATGNVGIGTTSPIDKLHIVGGLTSTSIAAPSNTSVGSLQIGYDGTNGIIRTWNSSPLITSTYNYQAFETSGSERMRITSGGNVLIGTTTNSGEKLRVDGVVYTNGAESTTTYTGGFLFTPGTYTSFRQGTDQSFNIDTYDSGSYKNALKILQSGAATFSSSVTANGLYANAGNSARFYRGANDYYWRIHNDLNNFLNFGSYYADGTSYGTNPKMILQDDGKIGIGTISPLTTLTVKSTNDNGYALTRPSDASSYHWRLSTTETGADAYYTAYNTFNCEMLFSTYASGGTGGNIIWRTGSSGAGSLTERMRITSGGNLLVGTTGTSWQTTAGTYIFYQSALNVTRDGAEAINLNRLSSNGSIMQFFQAGTNVGNISVTGSATAYNTSSDYRLKTDYKDFNGLDLVSKIKAYDYEWEADKTRSYGVIAHELQSVINYAVTGVKDGKEMQGVDYSKIVPVLIKAIQELNDKIK